MYKRALYQKVGNYTIGGQPVTMGGGSGGMVSGGVVLVGIPLPFVAAVACRVLGLVVAKRVTGLSEMGAASSLGRLGSRLGGTSGSLAVLALSGGLLAASSVVGGGVCLLAGVRLPARGLPLGWSSDRGPVSLFRQFCRL